MRSLLYASYISFLGCVVYFSYFFVDPNLSYLRWLYLNFRFQSQPEKITCLFLILCLFFVFYFVLLKLYRTKYLRKKDGIMLIGITVLVLLFAYPAVYSYDIFNYIATAKVAFLYRENPYIIMPIELTRDPLLAFMHAPNKVALYGPVWIFVTALPFMMAGGNFIIALFFFKIVTSLSFLILVYLLYKISKDLFVVLFFALNPLVIIEVLWSGHNDVIMMALLLSGYYFYLHKRKSLGILFYCFSILTKYATVILLPAMFFMKYFNRKNVIQQRLVFRWSMYSMIVIFLLSSFREEIYPWYAIWFLPFVALSGKRQEKILAIVFSFCLELRYFPYMIYLTHFGLTPILKTLITFVPVLIILAFLVSKKIWGKVYFRYL